MINITYSDVKVLAQQVADEGGILYLCGGSIRDMLLGIPISDFDCEIHLLSLDQVERVLENFAFINQLKIDKVGKSFTVFKVGQNLDVSIPRLEKKSGVGHKAFEIIGDPFLGTRRASQRRDFTINSLYLNVLTDEIIDHFGGQKHLEERTIAVIDPHTFRDDSLRVLRAAQFAARFNFTVADSTKDLCNKMNLFDLPKERIWGEFEKLLLSKSPQVGMKALKDLGINSKLFPELHRLDLYREASDRMFEMQELIVDLPKEKKITLMLAALCHDLEETKVESLLNRLDVYTKNNYDVRGTLIKLLEHRHKPTMGLSESTIKKLACKVELDLLYKLSKADHKSKCISTLAPDYFITIARSSSVDHEPEKPFLQGRHLLELGLKPSQLFGQMIDQAYQLQLEGKLKTQEEAIQFAREYQ